MILLRLPPPAVLCETGIGIQSKRYTTAFRAYGEDRILFGSDLPWSNPYDEIRMIDRMPISDSAKDKIFYKNAAELLKIDI